MDTTIYTVAKYLIMPPGGLIILFLIGFFLVRGVLGRVFIFVGLTVLWLMSLPMVAGKLIGSLESFPALEPTGLALTPKDGILVLGAGRYSWAPEYGGDTVGGTTLRRLRYGARLHRITGLPVYVTAGGPPEESPPLGRLMARVMEEEYGVPVAGVEDRSLTTWENAERSAPMLKHDGIERVLLVTSASHMQRALDAFERIGVTVIPAPTVFLHRDGGVESSYRDWLPTVEAMMISYYGLHEWVGQAWYHLKSRYSTNSRSTARAARERSIFVV